jgi:hypothetical protein
MYVMSNLYVLIYNSISAKFIIFKLMFSGNNLEAVFFNRFVKGFFLQSMALVFEFSACDLSKRHIFVENEKMRLLPIHCI